MGDKSWKAWERRVARWFPNARRRGADFRSEDAGKSDVICDGWSIECKLLSRVTYGEMVKAVAQSEKNRPQSDDIPIAVIKKLGIPDKDALVVMRLEEFSKYFINQTTE